MRDWWGRQTGVFKGSVCLAAAGGAFVGISALVHAVGPSIPAFQIAFLQQAVVVALIAPGILRKGLSVMRPRRPLLHLARCLTTGIAILSGFVAMAHLPVSETTALLFSRMLFTAGLAMFLLREAVGLGTWARIGVAGVGVLLVLSPDVSSVDAYGLAALVSALAISLTMLLIRVMKDETAEAIVGWQAIGLVALFAGPAVHGWVPMGAPAVAACVAVGVLLWLAQHLNVLAYRHAAAGAIQPAEASRLVVALAVDAALFGSVPSLTVAAGVGLILAAAAFGRIAWRREALENG